MVMAVAVKVLATYPDFVCTFEMNFIIHYKKVVPTASVSLVVTSALSP